MAVVLLSPPNSTRTPLLRSQAMAGFARGEGLAAGVSPVHADPFHSHRSCIGLFCWLKPPNRVIRCRLGFHAKAPPVRAGGSEALTGAQLVPFQAHDSVKRVL